MVKRSNSVNNIVMDADPMWKVGDLCVALWIEDNVWYNSQIVEINGDRVLVRFVKYGNEDYTTLHQLKPSGSLDQTLMEAKEDESKVGDLCLGQWDGESQAPLELESMRMVSTPDLLAGLTPDGSATHLLQQQEEADKDETLGDELPSDVKGISTNDLHHELVRIDPQGWSDLPDEVVLTLFKLMKPGDILAASQTCSRWRRLVEDDELWQHMCSEAGHAYCLNSGDLKIVKRLNEDTNIVHSPWKVNFFKMFKIERKFRQGVPRVLTIERNYVGNFLELFNDKIVYIDRGTLYVFSALTGGLLHELVGHTMQVSAIQLDEDFVVSANRDGSLKVWNVDTGSCLHTMLGHTGRVYCLQMHRKIAVSGSRDNTLRMWDVQEGSCLRILAGHSADVNHVQFDGRRVVSGSDDKTIKVWDSETGVCLHTLHHNSYIQFNLKFNGVDVVADYEDRTIKVWEVDTGVCRHNLEANYPLHTLHMELQDDMVVCRSWADNGRTADIWSMSTGARLHVLAGPQQHSRSITGIQLNEKFVVTTSMDSRVKLWDIKTGEFIRDLFVLESNERVDGMRMKDAKIVLTVSSNERPRIHVLNFDTNDEGEVADGYNQLQGEKLRREDEEWTKERTPLLEDPFVKLALKSLEDHEKDDDEEFAKFLFDFLPPKHRDDCESLKTSLETGFIENRKKMLQKMVTFWHPDGVRKEEDKKHYIICEEVTKRLTNRYERLKC